MARRVWLLVEWIDENNVFSSYGIVNVDTFAYKESDLQPERQIFISLKRNHPRCAKIIQVSDNKNHLKEHKDFLERQDQQVKNVLQLCMRTIKELKSDQYQSSVENSPQHNITVQHSNGLHHLHSIITANSENSASDSDLEDRMFARNMTNSGVKYINQTQHQHIKKDSSNFHKRATKTPAINQRSRSMISSTPLPGIGPQENTILYFDQGTQTDNTLMHPPIAKIEEIELVLNHLYGRFQSLVMKVNNNTNTTIIEMSEFEQNDEISYLDPNTNESVVGPNNVAECVEVGNTTENNNFSNARTEEIPLYRSTGAEEIPIYHSKIPAENRNENDKVNIKMEAEQQKLNDSTRVRKMSAQTTNTNDMVPIGNGNAAVPARLLNEIDWNSYTSATRQLLQAIFPRKVLATHSLTGKQSPAHLNKPAKKLLDPKLVDDVIMTVSSRCGIPKNLVRNTITVKCTDEAKLYRNRQRYQSGRARKHLQNDENIPPSVLPSSDESSNLAT